MNYKPFIRVVGQFIIVLSGSVILGWVFDIALLKSMVPGYSTMKLNTAICLLLSGGLLLGKIHGLNAKTHFLGSLFVFILGSLSFSQDLFNLNLGIDELFIVDRDKQLGYSGRMAVTAAISFMLIGSAFLMNEVKRFRTYAQYAIHFVTLISFIALLGYFFQVPTLYRFSFLSAMALHTSVALFIFSIAFALLNSELGLAGLFSGNGVGNKMARTLFPRMVVFIVLFSFLRLAAHRLGLVNVDFGIALFAISFVLVGLALIWNAARKLNESDELRATAEEEIRIINRNLEQMVNARTQALQDSLSKLMLSEQELIRNQALTKGIIDHAGASIFVKDISGRYILSNKNFAENFQLSPDSIRLKTAHDLFPATLANELVKDEQAIIQSQKSITTQVAIRTADGKDKVLLTNKFPILDERNHVYAIGVLATDITAQKRAEANLHAIFNSAWVSIIETNLDGLITQFNRGAELLLGYKAEEVVGQRTPEFIHAAEEVADRRSELSMKLNKPINGFDVFVEMAKLGKYESREWTYIKKDGTRFPVQLVVSAIRDEDNVIYGFLGIATDITQLKNQQALIERQNADLEQLNHTKDKFFSIVAHDLKSPLNSLKAFSSLLSDQVDVLSKEEITNMSRELRGSVDNTIKMADNLIAWARLQMNDISHKIETVNVQEIVSNVCDVYKPVARAKGIDLVYRLEGPLSFFGDRDQIEFVIRNLINNAVKFTTSGGKILLTAHQSNKNSIEIKIQDTGIGMPQEKANELFFLGSKHSTAGTAGEKGTGLGLMLSAEFVKLNGGRIQVESSEGRGTAFIVTLPSAL